MSLPISVRYTEAKSRVVRHIDRIKSFVAAAGEYKSESQNFGKRAKIEQMLKDLNEIRQKVEEDVQYMEQAVSQGTAPTDVTDTKDSRALAAKFDGLYYELAAFADVHKFSLSPIVDQSLSSTHVGTSRNGNVSHYQLPARKFPIFSGDITEWQGFDDLFNSIMSHSPDLPDVERFEFLKTSLEGDAKAIIAHLPLTAANYRSAWEILRARYGNKRDLARVHLVALLAPHPVRSTDATSIKALIHSILENTAALDNLNLLTRQWSPVLIHIFEQHLDYELRARWELILGEIHHPQLTEFIEFLRSHVRAAEARLGYYSTETSGIAEPFKSGPKKPKGPRLVTSPRVLVATARSGPPLSCPLCKQVHSIRKCSIFVNQSPNERFQTAKTLKICINCLGSGHTSTTCQSKHTCKSCNKSHHTLLHFPDSPAVTEDIRAATTTLVATNKSTRVILSTLLVSVTSIGNQTHTLRALLDTGSQVSFITKQCADRLSLIRRRCTTKVSAFSGTSVNAILGVTSIQMTPVGKSEPSLPLDVLIVTKITDDTPQDILESTSWPHLNNLELADPTFQTPGPIDILLGADIAPAILTGNRIVGQPSEPTAFGTLSDGY